MPSSSKRSYLWFAATLSVAVFGLIAGPARAAIVGDSATVDAGELSSWFFEEENPFMVEDASLNNVSNELSDAYDGFWGFYVNGNAYNPTTGIDVVRTDVGAVVSDSTFETNGIRMRQKFVTHNDNAILTALFWLKNTGANATTVSVDVYGDVGSDNLTTNVTTSSGDALFDTGDRWLITDGDSDDPINTFVYSGPGASLLPTQMVTAVSNDQIDVYFGFTLAPGESKSLIFFSQLSTDVVSAIPRAALFDNVFTMRQQGLFEGLNGADLHGVANWNLPKWETINDVTGDGVSDLATLATPSYYWYFLNSDSNFVMRQLGFEGALPVTGDFDGDGRDDQGAYDPATGTWYLNQSTAGVTASQFGFGDVIPVPADYDGDGKADIAVFDGATATWYLNRSSLGFVSLVHGAIGGQPLASDFDGNGSCDLTTFDPATAQWSIFFTGVGTAPYAQTFGVEGMIPVPADYDGDGASDIAVYSPGDGIWYIQGSFAGFWTQQFGFGNVVPVPGDYDSDKAADFGVYDPTSLMWYTIGNQGNFHATLFGVPGGTAIGGKQ